MSTCNHKVHAIFLKHITVHTKDQSCGISEGFDQDWNKSVGKLLLLYIMNKFVNNIIVQECLHNAIYNANTLQDTN